MNTLSKVIIYMFLFGATIMAQVMSAAHAKVLADSYWPSPYGCKLYFERCQPDHYPQRLIDELLSKIPVPEKIIISEVLFYGGPYCPVGGCYLSVCEDCGPPIIIDETSGDDS